MGNKYLLSGRPSAYKIRDLFATIAPHYDLINDLQSLGFHRYWKNRMLRFARVRAGERVLDFCCGTGDITLSFSRSGGNVVGLDFSDQMLTIARSRLSAFPNANLIRGNALYAPFQEGTFDVATISYGLRNLPDVELGLAEMARVLKAGGRLLVLDFGKPKNRVWRAVFFAYLRCFVPLFGKLFFGESQTHGYILESLRRYPAQEGVSACLNAMGCKNVRLVNFLGGGMSLHYAEKG